MTTCSTLSSLSRRAAAVAAVLLWASGAFGADKEEAKAFVGTARTQYQLGHFAEAAAAYEKAYELTSAPALLYNIAQCHRMSANFERAAFFYQQYLSTPPPIFNEAMAKQLLVECQKRAKELAKVDDASHRAEAARRIALEESLRAEDAARRADQEAARLEDTRRQLLELSEAPRDEPVTRKWWFWTALGVVVVGAGTATAVAVTSSPSRPATTLGDIKF